MSNVLRPALSLILLMSLITGVAYPLAVTGVAQLAFAKQADGSLMRDADGKVRGSTLIAQPFTGEEWFQPRPSAGAYATVASGASNLAPSNPALASRVTEQAAQLAVPGRGAVPLALLTTSGSGLDPHLSPAAADWQVARVAAARQMPADQVRALVEANTQRPLIGPPVVNVMTLNMSLNQVPSAQNL
ncbi:potassium-transporting ATPase subunit KdpC [Pseudomonas sp. v388]|uniref:potassium-transporting ATPase subunit KdpC n=1 Tax=Pseudomonas sp. v388 TaxID=2479849 RepID=UPI000F788CB9|nr:potassium-transporting ATPase subunit KdpC [Pseudomonas sp. v388]RRV05407.1 potassium-transporting ATPase subunit KdpC [Pseudomonas sp. v388]